MRDQLGDRYVIDLIESDAGAFASQSHSADDEPEPSFARSHRRWMIAASISSVVAIVAAGLLIWSPWHDDEMATPIAHNVRRPLTLTDGLIFGDPPAELAAASFGTSPDDGIGLESLADGVGAFFADTGASWNLTTGQALGTWAHFLAFPEGHSAAPDGPRVIEGETEGIVQGAPAVFVSQEDGTLVIRFGPVDGWMFTVTSSGMTLADTRAFADAVGVDGRVASISDTTVLGSMHWIGDVRDYRVAVGTLSQAVSSAGHEPGIASVRYGGFRLNAVPNGAVYSLVSQPVASESALPMLQFISGGYPGPAVHGQPAIAVSDMPNAFGDGNGPTSSVVGWVEGGRLIIVAGPDDVGDTLALAESVRAATAAEWAEVVAVSIDPSAPDAPTISFDSTDSITLYNGDDAATGDTFSFTAQYVDGEMRTCVEERTASFSRGYCNTRFVALPLLMTSDHSSGRQFVFAVIDREVGEESVELRITLADGMIEVLDLQEYGPVLPGPAAATVLPEDHGAVELWIGGEVVATI